MIQIDSREKPRAVKQIITYFDKAGIQHFVSKLPVGDYMSFDNPRLIIDRKQNLQELCGNVCQQHKRFTNELQKANDLGIQLIFLCEHSPYIKSLEDVKAWQNPRLKASPMAVSGERLFKILSVMEKRYNTKFLFCSKANTGKEICRILSSGM